MAGFQQGFSRPQKENDKKPKSGLPRKRSRKAKNRNEHRLPASEGAVCGKILSKPLRRIRRRFFSPHGPIRPKAAYRDTTIRPRTRCAVTRRKRTEDRPASGSPQLPSPHAHRPALRKGEIQKGIRKFGCPFAESGGFEPPVPVTRYGSLANCWFQPLTQLSFHKGARLDRGTKLIHFYEIPNSRRIFSRFPRVDPLRRIRR